MDIRLLGNVEIHGDDGLVRLARSGERCVLATLALDPGRPVSAATLADNVWSSATQSDKAIETVADYVRKVRGAIKKAGGRPDSLRTDRNAHSYVLDIDRSQVDYRRFVDLAATGEISLLQQALALWRGPALADVRGLWAEGRRYTMETERLAVYDRVLTHLLDTGHHAEVTRTVTALIDEVTPTERLLLLGARGMAGGGHHAAIRRWIDRATQRLSEATGAEPSAELIQQVEQLIAGSTGPAAAPARPVPRQLPAPPSLFGGREREVAELDKAMSPADGAMMVATVSGLGGIGKTWLALHWAHQHLDQFPDGQLFVDLRGFTHGADPLAPGVALSMLLDGLGVPVPDQPTDQDAQAGLYRTLVSDRRMLIVLDNARDTTQVKPLLPGSPTCAVIVTSRDRLPGLATAHAAHSLTLDTFDRHRAHDLLVGRLGPERLASDPDAVARIVHSCGGLPLALSIVAGRVGCVPDRELRYLAAELQDTETRLSALDDGDPVSSVPAALSWSYAALSVEEARVFGLLGLMPGPDFGLGAVASLSGLPIGCAAAVLNGLTRVCLLDAYAPGRWRLHDVVGLYAAEQAGVDSSALSRLVDYYLHTAAVGRRVLHPQLSQIDIGSVVDGCRPSDFVDGDAALAWFEAEHACLLAVQRLALRCGWYDKVWQLAWALIPFHWRRGHVRLDVVAWQCAVEAVSHLSVSDRSLVHRNAGQALGRAGRHGEALGQLAVSLELAERCGDGGAQAQAHLRLAQTWSLVEPDDRELTHARQAARLYRHLGDSLQEATALNSAGWAALRLGSYDEARDMCEAALGLFRRHQQADGQAAALDSLGLIAFRGGRHGQALEYYREALDLSRDVGDTYNGADVLDRLGCTYLALGRVDCAVAAWEEALGFYQAQERFGDVTRVSGRLAEVVLA